MKPLILAFAEKPKEQIVDASLIEYSSVLHLTVLKGTNIPAVNSNLSNTSTTTRTFATREGSDLDKNLEQIKLLVATQTFTKSIESSDRD